MQPRTSTPQDLGVAIPPVEGQAVAPAPAPEGQAVMLTTPLGDVPLSVEAPIIIGTPEAYIAEVNKVLKTNYTNLAEAMDVVSRLSDTQSQIDAANEAMLAHNTVMSTLNTLPEPLQNLIAAHLDGKDAVSLMSEMVNASSMNYNIPFEAQDQVGLINKYTGQQFTKEVYEALDPVTKSAITSMAKKEFERAKASATVSPVKASDRVSVNSATIKASFETSLQNLRKQYPQLDKAKEQEIATIMAGGIASAFTNPDGSFKPEAASQIAMAKYGDAIIQTYQKTLSDYMAKATSASDSKALENLAGRAVQPVRPAAGGGVPPSNPISEAADKTLSFLKGGKGGFRS